jgi:hypothetical protein
VILLSTARRGLRDSPEENSFSENVRQFACGVNDSKLVSKLVRSSDGTKKDFYEEGDVVCPQSGSEEVEQRVPLSTRSHRERSRSGEESVYPRGCNK